MSRQRLPAAATGPSNKSERSSTPWDGPGNPRQPFHVGVACCRGFAYDRDCPVTQARTSEMGEPSSTAVGVRASQHAQSWWLSAISSPCVDPRDLDSPARQAVGPTDMLPSLHQDNLLGPFGGSVGWRWPSLLTGEAGFDRRTRHADHSGAGVVNCVLGMTGVPLEVSQPIPFSETLRPPDAPSGSLGRRGTRGPP